jgi:HSP20 family protein
VAPIRLTALRYPAAPNIDYWIKGEKENPMANTVVEVKKHERPAPAPIPTVAPDMWQTFQNQMDQVFDRFWRRGFGFPSLRRTFAFPTAWPLEGEGLAAPAMDFTEDEKTYRLTAELPGMSEKDIDVQMSGDMLTIKGEKRQEKEEKAENYYVSERRFGSFQRSFTLPDGIDRDKIEAGFEKGVLTITLPKTPETVKEQKKIEVKAK